MSKCGIEKCTVNDCDNDHVSRGYCHKHYKRWRVHGDPMINLGIKKGDHHINKEYNFNLLLKSHMDDKNNLDKCWEWSKRLTKFGYAHVKYKGKTTSAHRLAYELINGEIPKNKFICHHCDNKKCFNINHLFIGSAQDNTQDYIKKFGKSTKNGEESHYAKLTEKEVHEIRKQIKDGFKNTEIAKKYKVSHGTISCIRLKITWNHLGENLNDNT